MKLRTRKLTLADTFLFSMIPILLLAVLSVGGAWLYSEYQRYLGELEKKRSEYIASMESLIREEVESAMDYIRFKHGQSESLGKGEAEIQDQILQWLIRIRFRGDGYLFGSTYEGDPLFTNGRITRGTGSVWDLTDPYGVKIIQSHKKAARNTDGGYVRYYWVKLNQKIPSPKISYVQGYEPWGWIIGAGVYVDEIDAALLRMQKDLKQRMVHHVLVILAILGLVSGMVLLLVRFLSRKMGRSMDALLHFFSEAATEAVTIDSKQISFVEFEGLADAANKMVQERNRIEAQREVLESRLRQAQKMEAIGTLAGGIAHDFNNLLFPIMGYAELELTDPDLGESTREHISEIFKAAVRARDLIRQILAFSRQDEQALRVIQIHPVIKEALQMLRSMIPSTIDFNLAIDADCGQVKCDPTQIHQIIMNLCTNAYHAMEEEGGTLSVVLQSAEISDHHPHQNPEIFPGKYICLRVADTGKGISADLIEKIFEPYFTTQPPGKGTGLGLSVVHGIVRRHNGHITVRSEPGRGTDFSIYLPLTDPPEASGKAIERKISRKSKGRESILLVDDEQSVVALQKEILERFGYRISACTSPKEALDRFRDNPVSYDLLITDLTMPGMTGIELARKIRAIDPELPVILCTGFSEAVAREKMKDAGIIKILMKPASPDEMADIVDRVFNTAG